MELVKACDFAKLDLDKCKGPSHQHSLWLDRFLEIYKYMVRMEKQKYSNPKFYKTVYPLARYLKTR